MTILKKRSILDIAAAPPPQAKKSKASLSHYADLMLMMNARRQPEYQSLDLFRDASPPLHHPLPRAQASVVTPNLPCSPREVHSLRLQPSSVPSPTSLPSMPFEIAGVPPPRSPGSRNPLEMLSDVSIHVADQFARSPVATATAPRAQEQSQPRATTDDDGESYVGDRNSAGQRHGRGIMKYSNGCRYVGCFSSDKRHGFGKVWYPQGLGVYTGLWAENKRHGNGTMRFANGDVYEGEWANDAPNGMGKLTMTNGESYKGGFVDRKKHGRGLYRWPDGDIYEGLWAGDARHGPGILMSAHKGASKQVYREGVLVFANCAFSLSTRPKS